MRNRQKKTNDVAAAEPQSCRVVQRSRLKSGMTVFLLLGCLCLAACGFRPVYGTGTTIGGGDTVLDQVSISSIAGPTGLMLKNALIDRFYHNGYPDEPRYVLKVTLQETARSIVIQKNDTTTRTQYVVRALYTLQDKATGKLADQGDIRAVSSYNILQSQYTTVVTQNQARELSVRDLANKIALRLAVVLEEKRDRE